MDLFKRHWKKDASGHSLVTMGRIMTLIFVGIGCLLAPQLGAERFKGIFNYIQEFQGFISPGILAAFAFGLIFKRTPASAGVTALVLNVPIYGFLLKYFGNIAFLNRIAITFGILILAMAIITKMSPLPQPKVLPTREHFDMKPAPSVIWLGALVIAITITLYIIFW
jgi:SSS family solute:Na+ symporter